MSWVFFGGDYLIVLYVSLMFFGVVFFEEDDECGVMVFSDCDIVGCLIVMIFGDMVMGSFGGICWFI